MKAPELSTLQRAWLQEIGIDPRLLARFASSAELAVGTSSETGAVTSAAVERSAAKRDAGRSEIIMPMVLPRKSLTEKEKEKEKASPDAAPSAPVLPVPPTWDALRAFIAECEACELHTSRSQTVFGAGVHSSPDWLVVGEAPGDFDDRAGLPFQGQAGVLLRAMLYSVGASMDRAVYCTNLVKCRPLGNRVPSPEEVAACLPYLKRQIALLKPRRILALGRLAAQSLLGQDSDLESLRGQIHWVTSESGESIPLVATYHPAALLLRPQHKLDAWKDLQLAKSAA